MYRQDGPYIENMVYVLREWSAFKEDFQVWRGYSMY